MSDILRIMSVPLGLTAVEYVAWALGAAFLIYVGIRLKVHVIVGVGFLIGVVLIGGWYPPLAVGLLSIIIIVALLFFTKVWIQSLMERLQKWTFYHPRISLMISLISGGILGAGIGIYHFSNLVR